MFLSKVLLNCIYIALLKAELPPSSELVGIKIILFKTEVYEWNKTEVRANVFQKEGNQCHFVPMASSFSQSNACLLLYLTSGKIGKSCSKS